MLFALAIIPVIGLLIFIYAKDKNEKESIGFLIGLFFAGMGTVISAIILEAVGELIFDAVIPNAVLRGILLAMLIVAPAEELGKYMILRLMTWKSRHFNYSYDAIVYAVFVSLGFAALENIGYVFSNGIGTAIMRMFTAVPGHACFAVFMGYFFSKAKYASLTGKRDEEKKNIRLTILLPIVFHGIYDGIVFGASESGNDYILVASMLLWIIYVFAFFVVSIVLIIKASKEDFCIISLPGGVQSVYMTSVAGSWTCACGTSNLLNFCSKCGSPRPIINTWYCPNCGIPTTFAFCGNCGTPRPMQQSPVQPQAPQYQQSVQPAQPYAQPGPQFQQPVQPQAPQYQQPVQPQAPQFTQTPQNPGQPPV